VLKGGTGYKAEQTRTMRRALLVRAIGGRCRFLRPSDGLDFFA
jgi:hypothetical protein